MIGGIIAAAVAATAGAAGIVLPLIQHAARPDTVPQPEPTPPGPQKLSAGVPRLSFTGHSDKVWTAVWDPTGNYLASAGDDTWIMLWDVQSALQKRPGRLQNITTPLNKWQFANTFLNDSLSWSSDGRTLAATPSTDSNIHLLTPFQKNARWQEYQNLDQNSNTLPPSYEHIAWTPHSNTFACTVDFQNDLLLWRAGEEKGPVASFTYEPPEAGVEGFSALAWSHDGKYIAGLTSAATVVVWDASTRQKIQDLTLPARPGSTTAVLRNALQWSPSEAHTLLVSTIDIVTVWDALENKLLLSLGTDDPAALAPPVPNPSGWTPHTDGLCWSPNGRYIAGTYGRSNKIYIWDLENTKSTHANEEGIFLQSMIFGANNGHTNTIIDINWSPNGRYLATTSFDKTVMVWQVDA